MPTYQYACTQCGESLEVAQKFSDEPLTECPACSGVLRKVFSPVGVVFKGSGFYKTDSRTKPKSTSAATTADAKTSDGTSTKTDSTASDSKSSDSKSSNSTSSDKKSSDKPASGTSTAGSGQVA
jgi:putative FmdB family regulatory protein